MATAVFDSTQSPAVTTGTGTSAATASFHVNAGELVVVAFGNVSGGTSLTGAPTNTGTAITWTSIQNGSGLDMWVGNSTVAQTIVVTGTYAASSTWFASAGLFYNVAASNTGAAHNIGVTSGPAAIALTSVGAGSLAFILAFQSSTTPPTMLTGNTNLGFNVAATTFAAALTVAGGAIGSTLNVGASAPSTATFEAVAVEVLSGTNGAPTGTTLEGTGFLRTGTGSLATSTNTGTMQLGFMRDSSGALVTSSGTSTMSLGFQRDSSLNLKTVAYASASAPVAMQTGFLRDANGSLVTVTTALAAAPLTEYLGFQRDANLALVIN